MKKRIIYGIIAIFLLAVGLFSHFRINNKKESEIANASKIDLDIDCTSAYLIEESSKKVIYAKDEIRKLHPASMTKMMGLLLVCEAIDKNDIKLDDMVSISSDAAKMGGSQVFLEPLEMISVDELLKCVCIASANDAMYALSELVGTTNANFVNMMNEKAKSLSLVNTNFVNVTGFDDDNHYTCAVDMANIALELLKYKNLILKYTSMYDGYIRENTKKPFWLVNTNKMVKFYQGMDGLKTGFTNKAGFCLTSTATRNNIRLVSVIMNSKTSKLRNEATKKLLDYGFSKVKSYKLYNKDDVICNIKINKAKNESYDIITNKDINLITLEEFSKDLLLKEIKLNDIKAPLKANDVVGKLIIKMPNQESATFDLVVKDDVELLEFKDLFIDYFNELLM